MITIGSLVETPDGLIGEVTLIIGVWIYVELQYGEDRFLESWLKVLRE